MNTTYHLHFETLECIFVHLVALVFTYLSCKSFCLFFFCYDKKIKITWGNNEGIMLLVSKHLYFGTKHDCQMFSHIISRANSGNMALWSSISTCNKSNTLAVLSWVEQTYSKIFIFVIYFLFIVICNDNPARYVLDKVTKNVEQDEEKNFNARKLDDVFVNLLSMTHNCLRPTFNQFKKVKCWLLTRKTEHREPNQV